ncbi:MAG: SpoIIE family protein phosphatase [Gemmatimonadetes bacterium]|nr:SpoIIE family protein phosphatase [Gemmatimonadota bacterium]
MLVRYDGEEFVPFTAEDGLAHNVVSAMLEDEEGHLWFGTGNLGLGGGVSRYSGNQFTSFTTRDGLAQDNVSEIMEDRKGDLWISTGKGETRTFARYDGEAFVHYAAAQWTSKGGGIALLEDRQGNLWFGRNRYDGRFFTSFTGTDELPLHPWHWSAATTEDKVGHLWFALFYGGVVRYDGKAFMPFTDIDNLASLGARSLLWDRRNRLWFGTWHGGLFRWDGEGEEAVHFTMEDGLGDDGIHCLFEDRDGRLWIGTWNGGVSWCDPSEKGEEAFHTLTQKDGLAGNWVTSIDQDRHGRLLLGTMGGGVSLYDGLVFQSLATRDGLASNIVFHVMRDSREDIWFCTEGGLTRDRPVSTPPPVEIVDVVADQRYGPATEVRLPTTQDHLAFLFQGRSFKTRLGQLAYVYRLEGYDDEWRTTREEQVAYLDLPIGKYRFQVKAVDRDLNYSEEPAQVRVTVHLPYAQLGLIVGLGLALFGLIVVSGYALKKRHDLFVEMEEELDTAHDMQMSLMPAESPEIDGFDIAGRCLPFNHVGGDFFQYFPQDGKLSICMADVTGHAMEAAVPVMMFSGVLKTEIRHGAPFDQLFDQLNRTMHDALDNRTYVCFCMGELDITARAFRLANAACPYPFHFHAVTGEVEEMQVDAYPLGVREGTIYTSIETELEPGDRIIFCSDGIAESTNMQEGMFGFERTSETIRQACVEDLSAEALIDRLIDAVQDFAGDMPQGDDMTVVVLKIEA